MAAEVPTSFSEPRVLHDVRVGFLCAFELDPRAFARWVRSSRRSKQLDWSFPGEGAPLPPLLDFRSVETFLLGKQLFFGRGDPIPSYPPIRGHAQNPLNLALRMSRQRFDGAFSVVITYFAQQRVLTTLIYSVLPSVTVDELIFLKEAKWYVSSGTSPGWASFDDKGSEHHFATIQHAILDFLQQNGVRGAKNYDWPVFDFIELQDSGPGAGLGPNPDASLTLNEHWGLLSGDEGYRLIAPSERGYTAYLMNEQNRFRGRDVFLYNFFHTSCLAFVARDRATARQAWQSYYRESVGYVKSLDDYIGLSTKVPCLTDGIPLLVEICLLRYVELARIDRELEAERSRSVSASMWKRMRGLSAIEQAVSLLHKLDLYQESSLWIIGGAYADKLFGYSQIRDRIDRTIEHSRFSTSDIRLFYVGFLSLLVGVAAVAASLLGK